MTLIGRLAALALAAGAVDGSTRCGATTLAGSLDQSAPVITSSQSAYSFGVTGAGQWENAQIFKVGTSGTLSGVNLQLAQMIFGGGSDLTEDVTVSIWTVSGAFPAAKLASRTLPASAIPRNPFNAAIWVTADFRAANISVTAGQKLAITATSLQAQNANGDGYAWIGLPANGYPDGYAEYHKVGSPWTILSGTYFGFQDYVVPVPEPGPSGLFAAGVLVLLWRRKRGRWWRGS